jgi:hypothetical protein
VGAATEEVVILEGAVILEEVVILEVAATSREVVILEGAAAMEEFMVALPVTDSRRADAVTLRGIMEAVGPTMGTVTTGITVHFMTGSMIIMDIITPTMTMTIPSMCRRHRAR